jgi:superfamily II DNA or RNA helicase
MVDAAPHQLTDLRNRMPEAGGLVIAPSIELAEYFVDLIEKLEGERPFLVHSKMQNPENKIDAFRKSTSRWLVSVAMVSEGVDIPGCEFSSIYRRPLLNLHFGRRLVVS